MSDSPWNVTVITLMPEMYPGPLAHSLIGEALTRRIWSLSVVNLRSFGIGAHQKVDDSPAGGGAGMVLKPDVIDAAVLHANQLSPQAQLVHFSPRGERMTQPLLRELAQTDVILLCGRYEAVDERVLEKHQPREISLGDFVLTGGDIPAMALIDGCVRLLPGVVGKEASLGEESFGNGDYANLLEYPHYTRPTHWDGRDIPEVLLSGHHENVRKWRLQQARLATQARRPDLIGLDQALLANQLNNQMYKSPETLQAPTQSQNTVFCRCGQSESIHRAAHEIPLAKPEKPMY